MFRATTFRGVGLMRRGGAGGGGSIEPVNSPDIILDGSNSASLLDSGGEPIADSESVDRWVNQGSYGADGDAVGSAITVEPVRKTEVLNGLDVVRFDTVGNDSVGLVLSLPEAKRFHHGYFTSVFVFVLREDVPSDETDFIYGFQDSAGREKQIAFRLRGNDQNLNSNIVNKYAMGSSSVLGEVGTIPDVGEVHVFAVRSNNGLHEYYLDGALVDSDSTLMTHMGGEFGGIGIRNNGTSSSGELDADIAEIHMWNRALFDNEFFQAMNNFKNKWAPSISIPSAPSVPEFSNGTAIVRSGRYKVPAGVSSMDVLVVAGGGGGGFGWGGGGGAGGLVFTQSQAVTPGEIIEVEVGPGGPGGFEGVSNARNGFNSRFGDLIEAIGGGGGANAVNEQPSNGTGADGGSGGGGRIRNSNPGGSGTAGQGNDGGDATSDTGTDRGSGGGGGAGAAGQQGSDVGNGEGGDGGAGLDYSAEFGTGVGDSGWFAGGGGGGGDDAGGAGGQGGGGAGKAGAAGDGDAGAANTGGGGGGAGGTAPRNGGDGGSGVVIVKW